LPTQAERLVVRRGAIRSAPGDMPHDVRTQPHDQKEVRRG
jgi:hypothetical protein